MVVNSPNLNIHIFKDGFYAANTCPEMQRKIVLCSLRKFKYNMFATSKSDFDRCFRFFVWQRCFRDISFGNGAFERPPVFLVGREEVTVYSKSSGSKLLQPSLKKEKKNFFQKQIFDPRFLNEEKNLREMKQKGIFIRSDSSSSSRRLISLNASKAVEQERILARARRPGPHTWARS